MTTNTYTDHNKSKKPKKKNIIEENTFDALIIKTNELGEGFPQPGAIPVLSVSDLRQALSGKQVFYDPKTHYIKPKTMCLVCYGEGTIKSWGEPDQPLQEDACGRCQGRGYMTGATNAAD